jgi:hypothetical protein
MLIVALDPGGTTGWACCEIKEVAQSIDERGSLRVNEDYVYTAGQIGPEQHHKKLWDALLDWRDSTQHLHLVVESFQFRQGRQRANIVLDSLEYIGVAKLFATMNTSRVSIALQTPASAKGFVSDSKIKRLGLWRPGAPHANDATRHLLYYQVNVLHDYSFLDRWKS